MCAHLQISPCDHVSDFWSASGRKLTVPCLLLPGDGNEAIKGMFLPLSLFFHPSVLRWPQICCSGRLVSLSQALQKRHCVCVCVCACATSLTSTQFISVSPFFPESLWWCTFSISGNSFFLSKLLISVWWNCETPETLLNSDLPQSFSTTIDLWCSLQKWQKSRNTLLRIPNIPFPFHRKAADKQTEVLHHSSQSSEK